MVTTGVPPKTLASISCCCGSPKRGCCGATDDPLGGGNWTTTVGEIPVTKDVFNVLFAGGGGGGGAGSC